MKNLLILQIFIFLFSLNCKAQVIDSTYLSCDYQLVYSKNKNDIPNKKYALMTLDIGNKYSQFYSTDFQTKDSLYYWDSQVLSGPELLAKSSQYKSKAPAYSIYNGYPNSGSITFCSKLIFEYFKYHESPKFEWTLTHETDTILNYPCLKATCEFAGRKYIAWFTTEIPVSVGPWKFSGTPGLILSISDSENHYSFQCIGIKHIKNKKTLIRIPERNYINCKKREFTQPENRYIQDPVKYINSTSEITITRRSSSVERSKFIYNPIEL